MNAVDFNQYDEISYDEISGDEISPPIAAIAEIILKSQQFNFFSVQLFGSEW